MTAGCLGEVADVQHVVAVVLRLLPLLSQAAPLAYSQETAAIAAVFARQWGRLGPLNDGQATFPPRQRFWPSRLYTNGVVTGGQWWRRRCWSAGNGDVHVLGRVFEDIARLLHGKAAESVTVDVDDLVVDAETAVPAEE